MEIPRFLMGLVVLSGTIFVIINKATKEIKNKGNKGKRGKTNEKQ
jgi:hypothetical protein